MHLFCCNTACRRSLAWTGGSALWCNSCSAQNLDLTGRADENVSVKGWWTAIVEMPVWRGPFRQQTCKCGGAC